MKLLMTMILFMSFTHANYGQEIIKLCSGSDTITIELDHNEHKAQFYSSNWETNKEYSFKNVDNMEELKIEQLLSFEDKNESPYKFYVALSSSDHRWHLRTCLESELDYCLIKIPVENRLSTRTFSQCS